LLLVLGIDAGAQTIFVARHAERTGEPDPPLNADGQRRAEAMARVLETAHPTKATLVIGHRSTVPKIVKALGGGDIAELRSDEHDRLMVITMLPGGKVSTVTLRYGTAVDGGAGREAAEEKRAGERD
jgi:hypothetical protein